MSDAQTFGPLVLETDIGAAVITTLQTWSPTYLDRMCRYIGQAPGWLQSPNSYVQASDEYHFPEEQPPAVVVAIPGTLGKPIRQGGGTYRALYDVRTVVYVEAPDRASTKLLAEYYGAAIRECLLQKLGSSASFVFGQSWLGQRYESNVPDRAQRTLGSMTVNFSVDVRDVVRSLGGPATVPTDPTQVPAAWPTVTQNTPAIISPQ